MVTLSILALASLSASYLGFTQLSSKSDSDFELCCELTDNFEVHEVTEVTLQDPELVRPQAIGDGARFNVPVP